MFNHRIPFIPNNFDMLTGGVYNTTLKPSLAGTLQQFGKAQEAEHGSFRQAEEAISLSFKSRGDLNRMEWWCLVWKLESNQ